MSPSSHPSQLVFEMEKESQDKVREYTILENCPGTLVGYGLGRDCSEVYTYDCGCAAADG